MPASSPDTSLTPLNLALSIRPFRSVIFVPELAEVPWQRLFRLALRGQTASWGGWGNLVLPMPVGAGADDELLWALLDVFDADTFHALPVTVADLEELAPDYYQRLYDQAQAVAPEAEMFVDMVTEQLRQKQLFPLYLDDALQRLLVRRLAPLSGPDEGLPPFVGEASEPPGWPLVPVETLKPLPDEVGLTEGWPDEDLALMGASVHGEVSSRLRGKLEGAGVRFRDQHAEDFSGSWSLAMEPAADSAAQRLALLGLLQYWRPGAQMPGLVVCIGDEPWDFAFATARERMQGDTRWVPSRAANDILALAAVHRIAQRVARRSTVPLRVCSVSSPATAARFVEELRKFGPDHNVSVELSEPLDLVPRSPGRLYERELSGVYQTLLVQQGRTPALPTPVPRHVETQPASDLRWMTDIDVQDWAAMRHPDLCRYVIDQPIIDGMTRCGREAVSYFCPGPMTWHSRSLESQVARPKLKAETPLGQIQAVIAAAGWHATPSDKGVYLQQTTDIFGGTDELTAALTDGRAPLLTVYLAKENSSNPELPGWKLDARRYLTFAELQAVYGKDPGAEEAILGLEDAGALIRGLVLRCERCRGRRFYRLSDLGDEFQCSRCWFRQPLNQDVLDIGPKHPEPPWRYGLAEVIFQFLHHNGDLPLLTALHFIKARAAERTINGSVTARVAGELDIFDPDGRRSELDVAIVCGTELWVGEATTAPRLERTNEDEQDRLLRLREVARLLSARGVLLINAASWAPTTSTRARAVLAGIWPRLEVLEDGPRAYRWSPPQPE